jgi:hypothetical protein
MANNDHLNSTLREKIVEHTFISGVLCSLWRRGVRDVEVLRSEFDASGYDLVLSQGRIVRHIQLKTASGRNRRVGIHRSLAKKASGCVVWINIDDALNFRDFYFFGGPPGEPLPDISTFTSLKRTTPNKKGIKPVRQNHVEISRTKFTKLATLDDVVDRLFLKSGTF